MASANRKYKNSATWWVRSYRREPPSLRHQVLPFNVIFIITHNPLSLSLPTITQPQKQALRKKVLMPLLALPKGMLPQQAVLLRRKEGWKDWHCLGVSICPPTRSWPPFSVLWGFVRSKKWMPASGVVCRTIDNIGVLTGLFVPLKVPKVWIWRLP